MARCDTGVAALAEEDTRLFDDSACVIRSDRSEVLISIEGFAGPPDSASCMKRLGRGCTEAAREYLVGPDGPASRQVRVLSYGEGHNRQVREVATGDEGRGNRRVSLAVDYAASQITTSGTASL